jgi:hypothetical protein
LGHTVGKETVEDDFVLQQSEAYMAAQTIQDPMWQAKVCIPDKKKNPTQCTFSSSIGDPPVPITNGMGVNRGLLLASRFGISRNNAKLCSCDCCLVKDTKTLKGEDKKAGAVCRKNTIGVVPVKTAAQCNVAFCNLRFNNACPTTSTIKKKQGMSQPTFNHIADLAETCEQTLHQPKAGQDLQEEIAWCVLIVGSMLVVLVVYLPVPMCKCNEEYDLTPFFSM